MPDILKTTEYSTFADAMKGEPSLRRKREARPLNPEAFARIQELIANGVSLPLRYIAEAVGTGAWADLMLNQLNKSLAKGWEGAQAALQWERLISFERSVRDFRDQHALKTGGFGLLDVVPESGQYQLGEFSDERADYAVQKYGRAFAVTMEAMTNDDLGELGKVAQGLGAAAARTLDAFVLDTLIDSNPIVYTTNNLFSGPHANDLGAALALNHDNLEGALALLRAQNDVDGNPLEIRAKYLLVPTALEFDARRLMHSLQRPGTGNNDANVHAGSLEVIPSRRLTSGAWYIVGDPAQVDTVEIGFLGGQRMPEVFEEQPNSGHEFAYDARRWKVRYIFGGAIVDYRSFVRANA
jgi:hypothetical protein